MSRVDQKRQTASLSFTRNELYYIENSMSCATPDSDDMGPQERSAYDKVSNALMRFTRKR